MGKLRERQWLITSMVAQAVSDFEVVVEVKASETVLVEALAAKEKANLEAIETFLVQGLAIPYVCVECGGFIDDVVMWVSVGVHSHYLVVPIFYLRLLSID